MTDFLKIAKSIVVHFAHICTYGVETVKCGHERGHQYFLCTATLKCLLLESVYIYICIYMFVDKKLLNRTLVIDSPFQRFAVDFLSNSSSPECFPR